MASGSIEVCYVLVAGMRCRFDLLDTDEAVLHYFRCFVRKYPLLLTQVDRFYQILLYNDQLFFIDTC